MNSPIAGWYPDPSTPGQQRYWDGSQWTEHAAPIPQAAPPPPPGFAPVAPGYAIPGYLAPHPGVPYAHWGRRVGASLIDLLLVLPFFVAAIVVFASNTTDSYDEFGYESSTTSARGWIIGLLIIALALGVGIWNRCIRQGRTGYSVGKQALGIKLILERNGETLGGWRALLREVLHAADNGFWYLGYLWPLWDAKRQIFADKIIESVVIVAPKPKR